MTHVVYFLAAVLAWLCGAALVAGGIGLPAEAAVRGARALCLGRFLAFPPDAWRPWHARTILVAAGTFILLAGLVVYLVAQ